MVVLGSRSICANALDRAEHSASLAWRTIQGREGRGGIVAIGGVQGILRIVLVRRIERVVGTEPVGWIHRVPGIETVRRVEDVVVALVLLVEAGFGECWCDGEEQRQQKEEDDPHGEPPEIKTANAFSLLFAWRTAQPLGLR